MQFGENGGLGGHIGRVEVMGKIHHSVDES